MNVFISHSFHRDREFVGTLSRLLKEQGHEVWNALLSADTPWASNLSAAIRSAEVLIAVVTGNNANVFFELGLAAGANIPILLTAAGAEALPADLVSIPFVQQSGDPSRDAQAVVRQVNELRRKASPKAVTFATAEATLEAAIREPTMLESVSPYDFETLVARLFEERGYEVTGPDQGRDVGADLILQPGMVWVLS
jgi:hypothetical protein